MRVDVLQLRRRRHTLFLGAVLPELQRLDGEIIARFAKCRGSEPVPRRAHVVAVPKEKMCERRGHAEVRDEELSDPSTGIEWESLFRQQGRINLEV